MDLHTPSNNGENAKPNPNTEPSYPNNGEAESLTSPYSHPLYENFDSTCSTPYVSAPSSLGLAPIDDFFYSALACPCTSLSLLLPLSTALLSSFENSNTFVLRERVKYFGLHEISGRVVLEWAYPTHEAFNPLGAPLNSSSFAAEEPDLFRL